MRAIKSAGVSIPAASTSSSVKTVTVTGASTYASSRLRAVIVISSIAPSAVCAWRLVVVNEATAIAAESMDLRNHLISVVFHQFSLGQTLNQSNNVLFTASGWSRITMWPASEIT